MKSPKSSQKKTGIWLVVAVASVSALAAIAIFSSLQIQPESKMLGHIFAILFISVVCVASIIIMHHDFENLMIKLDDMLAKRNSKE